MPLAPYSYIYISKSTSRSENMMDWTKPQKVDDVLLAFPGSVRHLMPPERECVEALRAMPYHGRGWIEFQRKWFFEGLPADTTTRLREGIDGATAFRHLSTIQGSYEPQHQHKEAAVAYLASLWFVDPPASKKGRKAKAA